MKKWLLVLVLVFLWMTVLVPRGSSATVTCDVVGTQGDDVITINDPYLTICAGAGNDSVYAFGFGDIAYGATGSDYIMLNGGTSHGGLGADTIEASKDHGTPDSVHGGDGYDVCNVEDNQYEPIDVWEGCEVVNISYPNGGD